MTFLLWILMTVTDPPAYKDPEPAKAVAEYGHGSFLVGCRTSCIELHRG